MGLINAACAMVCAFLVVSIHSGASVSAASPAPAGTGGSSKASWCSAHAVGALQSTLEQCSRCTTNAGLVEGLSCYSCYSKELLSSPQPLQAVSRCLACMSSRSNLSKREDCAICSKHNPEDASSFERCLTCSESATHPRACTMCPEINPLKPARVACYECVAKQGLEGSLVKAKAQAAAVGGPQAAAAVVAAAKAQPLGGWRDAALCSGCVSAAKGDAALQAQCMACSAATPYDRGCRDCILLPTAAARAQCVSCLTRVSSWEGAFECSGTGDVQRRKLRK